MTTILRLGALWLGLALVSPTIGRAQQAQPEPSRVPSPKEVKPASDSNKDRVHGGVIGGIVGAAVGAGLVSLLYVTTKPDGPSESQVELHGPGGEGGYENVAHVLMVIVVGAPLVAGSVIGGIFIGASAANDERERDAPKAPYRAAAVTPVAAISPDGAYLGARLTF